jgi:hypothetical protein
MRIASYNVENLFERAIALSADVDADGAAALVAQSEINVLLRKAMYTDPDRARIVELLTELRLRDDDDGKLVILRQNRCAAGEQSEPAEQPECDQIQQSERHDR